MKRLMVMVALLAVALPLVAASQYEQINQLEHPDAAWFSKATLEPYVTLGWEGVNGEARGGAGANLVFDLSHGLSLWGFGESDNTAHSVIDRAGAGLRYTAKLSKQFSLDGGIAGAYDLERDHVFARLPLGATFTLLHSKTFDAGLRVAYAFDINGDAKHSNADGRLFAGPTATLRW